MLILRGRDSSQKIHFSLAIFFEPSLLGLQRRVVLSLLSSRSTLFWASEKEKPLDKRSHNCTLFIWAWTFDFFNGNGMGYFSGLPTDSDS